MTDQPSRRRSILKNVLTLSECHELILIARCCSAVGYRENCCAVTSTVLARICPHFLPKLISIRERIQDAVEDALGLQLSLLIEFTGLISWRPGSSIGWHTDSNRKHLTQRFAAAVLYLNENELDFQGGNFKFRQETCPSACLNNETNSYHHSKKKETEEEEEKSNDCKTTDDVEIESIAPVPGLLIAYTTSEEHCVDPEITSGERFTLAMWFTTDSQHDEDLKILETLKVDSVEAPLPAAMHALLDGVDLRLCRLACYGVCLLKKRGERWVPLTSLEDGEWNRKQRLQLGVLKNSGKGEEVVVLVVKMDANRGEEGGIQMSVQQAVVAVQGSLLVEKSDEEAAAVACEKVCLRHLNAFPGRVPPRIQENFSTCSWLDESDRIIVQEVQGSSSSAAEKRLEILIQAIRTYIDVEEPQQLQIWEETKERWLKAGAVF